MEKQIIIHPLLFKKLLEEGHLTTQKEVISRAITLNGALTEVSFDGKSIMSRSTLETEDGWLYDTGQILRSKDLSPINSKGEKIGNLKIIGVASSAFGLSRFSRAFEEGLSIGKTLTLSAEKSKSESPKPSGVLRSHSFSVLTQSSIDPEIRARSRSF